MERNGKSAGERGRRERGKWRGGVCFAEVHSELGGMINYRLERGDEKGMGRCFA